MGIYIEALNRGEWEVEQEDEEVDEAEEELDGEDEDEQAEEEDDLMDMRPLTEPAAKFMPGCRG